MSKIIAAIVVILAITAVSASAVSASSQKGKSGFFKTQNGQIYCGWVTGSDASVVCGIKNGYLKPKPKNNCKRLHVDYVGNRVAMTNKSRAKVQQCAGDAGPFASPKTTKVLKPGKTLKAGGFTCKVTKSSATCTNSKKHGFTITTLGPYKVH